MPFFILVYLMTIIIMYTYNSTYFKNVPIALYALYAHTNIHIHSSIYCIYIHSCGSVCLEK